MMELRKIVKWKKENTKCSEEFIVVFKLACNQCFEAINIILDEVVLEANGNM